MRRLGQARRRLGQADRRRPGVRTGVELHPDVRYSLALDEGFHPRAAEATLHPNRLKTVPAGADS
jgi:hypothetical protein